MWKLKEIGRFSLLSLVLVGLLSGCSTWSSFGKSDVPVEQLNAPGADLYLVEIHQFRGETIQYKGSINPDPPNPTTVQTALEASGALKQLKNMEINVYRRVPGSPRSLKMPVTFEADRDAVSVEQDYALHKGDRIVVKPANSGAIGGFLESLTGISN